MIDLFPFQQEDVDYLSGQRSCLIANEMGTGKTYEAIAMDLSIRANLDEGRTLVVAPLTTLESTWQYHFEELTDLDVTVLNPKDRIGSWSDFLRAGDVLCVHWEALRLMPELAKIPWQHVIADECHRAKNRKAQQTRALKTIPTLFKTAMSGTPVVNRPDELWSILNWLYPKQYSSYWRFFNKYVQTQTKYAGARQFKEIIGPMNVEELRDEIRPFYVRRRKQDVLKDLPDKYYTKIHVNLVPEQRRVYESMRKEMIAWIGEQQEDVLAAPVVIAQLTRLQQFSCAYAEIDPESGRVRLIEPSSKLDALEEILDDTEEQVVVFSRFRQLIKLLDARLRHRGIPAVTLTGETPQADRAGAVADFQSGNARVFAGTIAAGGVGITLHSSSTVVFLDRDWSPALNAQAEDRLHRIGQRNAVQVIDIVARNTVDLGRDAKLDLKKSWIRQILGDT
jgi:SNF2 family DNA or RNA helicase